VVKWCHKYVKGMLSILKGVKWVVRKYRIVKSVPTVLPVPTGLFIKFSIRTLNLQNLLQQPVEVVGAVEII